MRPTLSRLPNVAIYNVIEVNSQVCVHRVGVRGWKARKVGKHDDGGAPVKLTGVGCADGIDRFG